LEPNGCQSLMDLYLFFVKTWIIHGGGKDHGKGGLF
jgi:hypothetical protein